MPRLEALAARSPACTPVSRLHKSQVLSHQPVDPDDAAAAEPRWPDRTTLRLAVRRKNGPFVSWAHVRITAGFDPAGGAAGVAVAVDNLPRVERAMLAVIDETARELHSVERRAGLSRQVAGAALPAGSVAPYVLEVDAFDDPLRAAWGTPSWRPPAATCVSSSREAAPRRPESRSLNHGGREPGKATDPPSI